MSTVNLKAALTFSEMVTEEEVTKWKRDYLHAIYMNTQGIKKTLNAVGELDAKMIAEYKAYRVNLFALDRLLDDICNSMKLHPSSYVQKAIDKICNEVSNNVKDEELVREMADFGALLAKALT